MNEPRVVLLSLDSAPFRTGCPKFYTMCIDNNAAVTLLRSEMKMKTVCFYKLRTLIFSKHVGYVYSMSRKRSSSFHNFQSYYNCTVCSFNIAVREQLIFFPPQFIIFSTIHIISVIFLRICCCYCSRGDCDLLKRNPLISSVT